MGKKNVWTILVLFVVGGVLFGFAPKSEWPMVALALAILALLLVALMNPSIRASARHNKKAVRIGGVVALVLSVCALLIGLVPSPPIFSVEIAGGLSATLMLFGILLLQLPNTSADVESALEAQKIAQRIRPIAGGFDPLEEVKGTYAYIGQNKISLAKVIGPWFAAFCTLMLLVLVPNWKGVIGQDRTVATWFLFGLLVFVLVELCLVLIITIQWVRFVVTGSEPSWSIFPGKALWGFLWRWIIFGAVFRATDQIDPWLKSHLPGASALELLALDRLCLLAISILASPFALGLPPVALNEPRTSAAARTLTFGIAGRKYYLGAALILAPFIGLIFAVDVVSNFAHGAQVTSVAAICEGALMFCLLIVGITFVTRVYAKGVAAAA